MMNAFYFTGKRNEKESRREKQGREVWMLIAEQPPFSTVVQLAQERFPCADEMLVMNSKTHSDQNSTTNYLRDIGSIICPH